MVYDGVVGIAMDMDRHDFELDELIGRIKSNDNRLVALQVPEGLKMQALDMMDAIEEETSAKIILAADPCYGACDLVIYVWVTSIGLGISD